MYARGIFVGLCLASAVFAGPLNGSFETGDLTDWTTGGGGAVEVLEAADILPGGSGLGPSDGSFFALVSNGPSGPATTGTLTSSSFVVGALGGTLSFDWDFLTSELAGLDFDPAFSGFDFFEVWLAPTVGTPILLLSDDVSNLDFELLPDIYDTPALVAFDQQLASFGALNSFSDAVLAGTYSLEFRVGDGPFDGFPDDDFDSALLIDNVRLFNNLPPPPPPPGGGPAPVPEPTSLVLVGLAGAIAYMRRRKR